jgi:hypothetical protein
MLILSRVCADFYDPHRKLLFRVTPRDLGLFVDAPESIKQDPLFQMLVDDGSVKFPEDARSNKALENDPMAGATAEGKEIRESKPKTVKPKADSKPETKQDSRQDSVPAEKPADKPAK